MRLAIISDIHGNRHALEAVLEEIQTLDVDQIIVNGDMVNRGPNNVAVMEQVTAAGDVLLLGNHDDLVRKWVDRDPDIPAEWFEDRFWAGTAWSARQLEEAGWIDALRNLPMTHEISLPGAPKILLSHGSPRHYREGYGHYLNDEQISEIVQMHPADILIGSHTHRPFEREWGRHLILNTGAVGAPFNDDPRAQYLLITLADGSWERDFRAVDYDRDAALAAYEESGYYPEGDLSALIFREELRYARPLYAPFWMWAETHDKAMNWASWHEYRAEHPERFSPL